MASNLNSINIIGRLTKDAELTFTNSGFAITKLSLAVNRSVKNGDNWEEQASFFDVTILGKRGESLNQYLQKGTLIGVNGELVQDRWEKDGQTRSRVYILCNNLQLLGGNSNGGQSTNNQGSSSGQGYSQPVQQGNPSTNGQANFQDNIPF